MTGLLKIDVDPGNLAQRQFTDLEKTQLPFALQQTVNRVAQDIQDTLKRTMAGVFDNPTRATLNAVFVKRARYTRGSNGQRENEAAIVLIKDQAGKGTPPAKYLLPQVFGGTRVDKGLDSALRRAGLLAPGEQAVPAAGAPLDGYGNIKRGIVQQVLSQLQANRESGSQSNETAASRARNARRGVRKPKRAELNRRYFAVRGAGGKGYTVMRDGSSLTSHLRPGVYMRKGKYRLTSIFAFVRRPSYRKRFDIFSLAGKVYSRRFDFYFERELAKAIETSKIRGRA